MTFTRFAAEDEWFDDDLVVQRIGNDPVEAALGAPLADFDLIHLSGAPRGSTVSCEQVAWPYDEMTAKQAPALSLKVANPEFIGATHVNEVVLYLNPRYEPELHIELMILASARRGQGMASLMFWRIARAASLLGIARITLLAVGGRTVGNMKDGGRWTGYYFWPSIGFDGDVSKEDRTFFANAFPHYPPRLALVSRVRDVFARPDGAAFWKLCGGNVRLCEFRTDENGPGMQILRQKVEALFGR